MYIKLSSNQQDNFSIIIVKIVCSQMEETKKKRHGELFDFSYVMEMFVLTMKKQKT